MNELITKAKQMLQDAEVGVVIGYERKDGRTVATPFFAQNPTEAEHLIFDSACHTNLATYLTREDHASLGRPAVVVKDADMRAVIALVQEGQLEADGVVLLSVSCDEMGTANASCCFNGAMSVAEAAKWLTEKYPDKNISADKMALVDKLEAMSDQDRWDFWEKEFSRCIRCYACRQACPLCYCRQCIVEKNQPQWIMPGIHPAGAMAWNITRAFHLAGRCVDCGECERVCPMDIPLTALNRKLARTVADHFDYAPGFDPEAKPVMANFKHDDKQEFFK